MTTPPPGGERACASAPLARASARRPSPAALARVERAGAITPEQRDAWLATYRRARATAAGLRSGRSGELRAVVARRRVARPPPAADLDADARRVPAAPAQRRVLAHARVPEGAAARAQAVHGRGRARRRARDVRGRPGRLPVVSGPGPADPAAGELRQGQRAVARVRGGAAADPRRPRRPAPPPPTPRRPAPRRRRPGAALRPEELRALLDRMVALASERGGFTAWEYFFAFGGGTPPWISGLAQGTAIQALTRGSQLLADPKYVAVARARARRVRAQAAARRPRAPRRRGTGRHYLIYSFATGLRVLNGFLQSLVGLHDFADATQRPPRAAAVPRRRPRRPARDPALRHRRVVAVLARRQRVRPRVPPARARLPHLAVRPHRTRAATARRAKRFDRYLHERTRVGFGGVGARARSARDANSASRSPSSRA